jgi:hypothetical protein
MLLSLLAGAAAASGVWCGCLSLKGEIAAGYVHVQGVDSSRMEYHRGAVVKQSDAKHEQSCSSELQLEGSCSM